MNDMIELGGAHVRRIIGELLRDSQLIYKANFSFIRQVLQ